MLKPLFALFINYVLFFGLVSALGSCQLKEFYFYLKHKDKNIFYLLATFPFPVVLNCPRNLSSCTHLSPVWILSCFFKCTVLLFYLLCGSCHVPSNTLYGKCLFTFSTAEWLFTCVDPFVYVQITTCFNCLVTCVAHIWPV